MQQLFYVCDTLSSHPVKQRLKLISRLPELSGNGSILHIIVRLDPSEDERVQMLHQEIDLSRFIQLPVLLFLRPDHKKLASKPVRSESVNARRE